MSRTWLTLIVLMLCALAPVLVFPNFVTQDGPAHLHSAERLLDEFTGAGHPAFEIRARPIPNVLGHLLLAMLSACFGPAAADKLLILLTGVGLAAATLFLRRSIRGTEDPIAMVFFAAFLSMNRLWLLGFYSFLLGCILFAVTSALLWRWQTTLTWPRLAAIAALLLLGYFAHPITLAATIFALLLIGATHVRTLLPRVAAAALPSVVLLLWYLRLASGHGAIRPEWNIGQGFGPRFFFIAGTNTLPFVQSESSLFGILAPPVLFAVALLILAVGGMWRESRAYLLIAAAILAAAVLGPEALGSEHGSFLRQRLFGLAAIASAPLWQFHRARRNTVAALLAVALLIQSALLLEYARRSDRVVRDILARDHEIGDDVSLLPLVIVEKTHFRALPEEHAANLLGLNRSRTVWGNYEADLYYFPVAYADPIAPCPDELLPRYDAVKVGFLPEQQRWRTRRFVCTALLNERRVDTLMTRGVPAERLAPFLEPVFKRVPPRQGTETELWRHRRPGL